MRIFVVAFAILAVSGAAAIDSPVSEYLPPSQDTISLDSTTNTNESTILADDGYRYKTVRLLKLRQRRDVSEIVNEYLPPVEETSTEAVVEVKAAEEPEDSPTLGENGYEYKTVRRLKYRQRRDVSEIANEYLPPAEETSTEAVTEIKSAEEPEDSATLGENGYEYKTVRRLKYRQRRDVSEIANEYLPPAEETSTEAVVEENPDEAVIDVKSAEELEDSVEAVANIKSAEEPQDSATLGENGYEYKTVRRLRYRQRRDVSEIANVYLPPAEKTSTEAVVEEKSDEVVADVKSAEVQKDSAEAVTNIKSAEEPEDSAALGENGYEYKTVRRLKYRQRRDVSEIANEYLPPAEETSTEAVVEESPDEAVVEVKSAEEPEESAEALANIKSAEEPQDSATLGENGYEYKTVRHLRYRQRRDVSEIANVYLPPAEETSTETVVEEKPDEAVADVKSAEVQEDSAEAVANIKSAEEPEDSATLGENGYEYKTVRRLKYRQRRDVSEIANEYLPPAEETSTEAVVEVKSAEEPQDSATLGENGYEYKTVRRLKYRQRRDVSEIVNEYLPPAEETSTEAVVEEKLDEAVVEVKSVEEPEDSATLGENGYEYKTVRRLKYRQRRDVSEISSEYLPPAEETSTEAIAEVKSVEEPEDSATVGENGYEYKTVRHLKYRQRRDVSEIANEYLPPAEETSTEAVVEEKPDEAVVDVKFAEKSENSAEAVSEIKSAETPEDSAPLGENGYEYKTVRRLKYRQRRDVSEIANEYLPPAEETSTEVIAEIKSAEEPEDTATLGENGYEYKTVRRLKYRQRRDVSEIANEYLPPAEESVTETLADDEVPSQDSATFDDKGYAYKTVRRLKYRQRRY